MKREPAIIIAFVFALLQAGLGLAAAFGWNATPEQQAAIAAVLAVIAGFITRQFVSPAADSGGK